MNRTVVRKEQLMTEQIEAIIIGAGHAGLSTSYYLTRASMPHLVLEAGRVGERWAQRPLGLLHPRHSKLDVLPAWLPLRRR